MRAKSLEQAEVLLLVLLLLLNELLDELLELRLARFINERLLEQDLFNETVDVSPRKSRKM